MLTILVIVVVVAILIAIVAYFMLRAKRGNGMYYLYNSSSKTYLKPKKYKGGYVYDLPEPEPSRSYTVSTAPLAI